MSLATNVLSLATRIATEMKAHRVLINGNAADLSALTTTAKTNLVAAINEVKAGSSTPPAASTTVPGLIEIATLAEVTTGSASTLAVTPQALKQETDAVKAAILGVGVPAALDTLDELAAALADDANFAATMTTQLAGKQPLDTDLTQIAGLVSAANKLPYATGAGTWAMADLSAAGRALIDDADVATQRATLAVYSTTEVGDPTTDFVAAFNAGLV